MSKDTQLAIISVGLIVVLALIVYNSKERGIDVGVFEPLPEIRVVEETVLPPLVDVVDLDGNTDPVLEWTDVVIEEELPPLEGEVS
ncbi:hypothetical protein [Marinobacter sp.]|uniref:hypothetical protein n=1 Tax=Marinobacter sp. TaxID=50741 RepID=UPI00118826B2|nr:hypothetical protein [Marinobacter sp.]QDP47717.1 MAG: hypothetical protein Tp1102SUR657482_30 [Prokaryotic dsDNA virus sp.]|tara:strand:- start:21414 stop:21671 length:258 start_codon:yes stop_codon:yes gene_type:complete